MSHVMDTAEQQVGMVPSIPEEGGSRSPSESPRNGTGIRNTNSRPRHNSDPTHTGNLSQFLRGNPIRLNIDSIDNTGNTINTKKSTLSNSNNLLRSKNSGSRSSLSSWNWSPRAGDVGDTRTISSVGRRARAKKRLSSSSCTSEGSSLVSTDSLSQADGRSCVGGGTNSEAGVDGGVTSPRPFDKLHRDWAHDEFVDRLFAAVKRRFDDKYCKLCAEDSRSDSRSSRPVFTIRVLELGCGAAQETRALRRRCIAANFGRRSEESETADAQAADSKATDSSRVAASARPPPPAKVEPQPPPATPIPVRFHFIATNKAEEETKKNNTIRSSETIAAEGKPEHSEDDTCDDAILECVSHTLPDPLLQKFSSGGAFDLVFARLCMHYFSEQVLLEEILPDIRDALSPSAKTSSGIFVFMVRTIETLNEVATAQRAAQGKKLISGERWRELLEQAGFDIFRGEEDRDGPRKHYSEEEFAREGRPWIFECAVSR